MNLDLASLGSALPGQLRPLHSDQQSKCGAPSTVLIGTDKTGSLINEILAKHARSPQPESRKLCAILQAVVEVLQMQGLQPTPTSLFAAIMSSLETEETRSSAEVGGLGMQAGMWCMYMDVWLHYLPCTKGYRGKRQCVAVCGNLVAWTEQEPTPKWLFVLLLQVTSSMCQLLNLVLPRVPDAVCAKKFSPACLVLISILETQNSNGSAVKGALGSLCQVLPVLNADDWPTALKPFHMLLRSNGGGLAYCSCCCTWGSMG
jgi:hypothetical protein